MAFGMLSISTMVSACEITTKIFNEPFNGCSILPDMAWAAAPWVLLSYPYRSDEASLKNGTLCLASCLCAYINMARICFKNIDRTIEINKKDRLLAEFSATSETINENRATIRALREQISLLQPQAREDLMPILQNPVVAIETNIIPDGYMGTQRQEIE
ncbi:MAG TPA: hypothetical protein VLG50_04530 [Candidatus Saccharimonadales bacterium]|nr:hypothetical protein [Candidatus Saccharimonadales bacterium]